MKLLLQFITILLLISICACNRRHVPAELEKAETIMHEAPDSALNILCKIDTARFSGDYERALYALLMSQALDKNHIYVTNDSLVTTAFNYFSSSKDINRKMLANYYIARQKYNSEDYTSCLVYFFNALECARELNDKYWMGLACRGISDTYNGTFNSADELIYAKKEYDYFKETGRTEYINYALSDLALSYHSAMKYDSALIIARQSMDSAIKYEDAILYYEARRISGTSHLGMDNFAKAQEDFEWIYNSGYGNFQDSVFLGYSYVNNNMVEEARNVYNKLSDGTSHHKKWLKCFILNAMDSTQAALDAFFEYDSIKSATFNDRISQSLNTNVINRFDNERLIAIAENKALKIKTILITCLSSFIIIILLIILYIHKKRLQNKIDENVLIAQQLNDNLKFRTAEANNAKGAIMQLMTTKYELLDYLCKLIYENLDSETTRKRISNAVDSLVKQITNDPAKLSELEHLVNSQYNNLVSDLKSDVPSLTDNEVRLFIFSVLGFSNSAIAIFIGEGKVSRIYNMRRHLKDKVKKLGNSKLDKYIAHL